ncbi:ATP-binding protein [Streptomyces sp. MS19]|uniref:SCO6881 family protein n=1 Tax=Streptomyces sp. MS19 TaxID=3385972 RepID=UPI0039A2D1FC
MAFCDVPVVSTACDAVGAIDDAADAASAAAEFAANPGKAIGEWMTESAGDLATAAADLAATAVDTTTQVDLGAAWFRDNYALVLPIGLVLLVGTFCAQLVRAALRRDGQALTQAFIGTMTGVLFSFAAVALTTVALDVTDALSDGLFTASGQSLSQAVRRVVAIDQLTALSGLGWLVAVFAALAAALGAFLFWCVMMVRKIGVVVMVTLAVFAGAGGGWEAARRWRRGWIEVTATLVASKLLMTVIFVLGIAAIGNSEAEDGIGALADVLAGIVIMALVLLCPYATFRFVHWASEGGADGEAVHRASGAGMQVARQHTMHLGRRAVALAAGGAAGTAAMSSAAPQGPDTPSGAFPGQVSPAVTPVPGQGNRQGGLSERLEKSIPVPPGPPVDTTDSGDPPSPASPSARGGGFTTVQPLRTPTGAPSSPTASRPPAPPPAGSA